METPNLFVCCTYFHLYVALAMAWKSHQKGETCTIVLSLTRNRISEHLLNRLSTITWARILDHSDQGLYHRIEQFHPLKKLVLNLFINALYPRLYPRAEELRPLSRSNTIYLFNDFHYLSRYIIKNARPGIILMEDGNNSYGPVKSGLAVRLKKYLGIHPRFGRHPRITRIMVQRPRELPRDIAHKGEKLDITEILNAIPPSDMAKMVGLFMAPDNIPRAEESSNTALLLTQPFYQFGRTSESRQIRIYKCITDTLQAHGIRVILKPHPSDRVDYGAIFPNLDIWPAEFPIEILNHTQRVKFKLAVGVNTSAVFNVRFTETNINLLRENDRFIQNHFHEALANIKGNLKANGFPRI